MFIVNKNGKNTLEHKYRYSYDINKESAWRRPSFSTQIAQPYFHVFPRIGMLKHMGDRPNMQMSESFRIIWNHSEFQIQVLNQFRKKLRIDRSWPRMIENLSGYQTGATTIKKCVHFSARTFLVLR